MTVPRVEATESEATLVIIATDAPTIARRLGRLEEIAGHPLATGAVQQITDTYVDTVDGRLNAARMALRIRTVEEAGRSRTLLTLKGKSAAKGPWQVQRSEIELPWSDATARRMVGELEKLDVPVDRTWKSHGVPKAPADFVASLGLRVLQRRTTERQVRDVVGGPEGAQRAVAELSIDRVRFDLSGRTLDLYEVEIEAKQDATGTVVDAVTAGLLREFGEALRPWRHSKLAIGRAIEELGPPLAELAVSEHRIGPACLDQIAQFLEEHGNGGT